MRIRELFLIGFICIGTSGLAQQRPINSMYMFDMLLINPAYAGNHVQLSATAIYRNQWVNFPGAPVTSSFSIQNGFFQDKVGVGLIVSNDQIGIHNDMGVYMSYAYKIKMNSGTLSMGLEAGFNNIKSDFDLLNIRDDSDANLSGLLSEFYPNFGTGFYFSNKQWYLGVSVPRLINNDLMIQTQDAGLPSLAEMKRDYLISFGTTMYLNKDVMLKPSTMIRMQEGSPINYDLNANLIWKETMSVGLSYRNIDSIVGLFELKLHENFHIGYAYDRTVSGISRFSDGSHEIMLNYRIKIPLWHNGVECPAFF